MSSILFPKANTIETKVHSNIDDFYGPYKSDNEAIDYMSGYEAVGLTVGIYTDESKTKIKEKWFLKNGNNWVLVDKVSDTYYGPYNNVLDALNKIPEDLKKLGLTVGIYTDESKTNVKEMWFLGDPLELVDKIKEYELVLNKFSIEKYDENIIKITYLIDGQGLIPVVSISNTNIQLKRINFGIEDSTYVTLNTPGVYQFAISVSDALGSKIIKNVPDIINFSYGSIKAYCTNSNQLLNLLPIQSSYENKKISVLILYNPSTISNVEVWLNDYTQQNYKFNLSQTKEGFILGNITLPTGNYYNKHNEIIVVYEENGERKVLNGSSSIYSFDILKRGEYSLALNNVPEVGYIGTSISFDVNVLYGGGQSNSKTISITLNNDENSKIESTIELNTFYKRQFIIPNITLNQSENGINYANASLKVLFKDDENNIISESRNIKIYEVTSPKQPCGTYYFNTSYSDVNPSNIDNEGNIFFNFFPETSGNLPINCSYENETIIRTLDPTFNIDFSIKTSLNGTNDPLIIINNGSTNLLTVGKLMITSSLFGDYQKNNLVLPKNNEYVHIGFGYQRRFDYKDKNGNTKQVLYDCIFINGEIAFCNKSRDFTDNTYSRNNPVLKFNGNFTLSEFSYNGGTEDTRSLIVSIPSCVNSGGILETDYTLGNGMEDVFYYNWRTLSSNPILDKNLTELQLIPIKNSGDESTLQLWSKLLNDILSLGSPIKKIKNFIKFGTPNYTSKLGIEKTSRRELFDLSKDDKENSGLDKKYAVLCKYKFVTGSNDNSNFENNKYCIVQVQGTSTLAYPVPNFLFTFIKYDNSENKFVLDYDIVLNYQSPIFATEGTDEGKIVGYESMEVKGESNLVAKADSMDSSHLNNTPTCIYINSLINTLSNKGQFTKFKEDTVDAIVGFPILIKIDTRDGENVDFNSELNTVNYNSYGTFMFNTGKSANNMGLNDSSEKVFSLEGLSNENLISIGSPGMFILPQSGEIKDLYDELSISFENDKVSINMSNSIMENSQEGRRKRYRIIEFLINSSAFESRSNIEDDDILEHSDETISIEEANNRGIPVLEYVVRDGSIKVEYLSDEAWNKYGIHILRMWLFVNKSTNELFKEYFTKVFNLDYASLYYINLLVHGQADNLGKNMMIDCIWKEDYTDEIWCIRVYDLDSLDGLTNNGNDDFPVYGCISKDHFDERYGRQYDKILPADAYSSYNSKDSLLWKKFWTSFKDDITSTYNQLRKYITPENIIYNGQSIVSDHITKEQYNIDFSLKHLGTSDSNLNKGGRMLNYKDWITKRFMYVDSYFKHFEIYNLGSAFNGYNFWVDPTIIPVFYEFEYLGTDGKLRSSVVYGDSKFLYENVLDGHMQYTFRVVPESIVNMYPIITPLADPVINGVFKNIRLYNGQFNTALFGTKDNATKYENLTEINVYGNINDVYNFSDTEGSDLNMTGYVPNSVNKLYLENININGSLKFTDHSSIESIYLRQCKLTGLQLLNLPLLREVIIENTTIEGTLAFNNLQLTKLELKTLNIPESKSYINAITIEGKTTIDDIIDLSGIKCNSITFGGGSGTSRTIATVKKLYLDLLYSLNGLICSPRDFGIDGKVRLASTSVKYEDFLASNIINNSTNEYIYLNYTNFKRISSTITSLDLRNCDYLDTFSCIGSNLEKLVLPKSVKILNLLFCKNLKALSTNEIVDANNSLNGFNFAELTGLKCSKYTLITRQHIGHNSSIAGSSRLFAYYGIWTNSITESFNLTGCISVKTISNINYRQEGDSNLTFSNFTGELFVSGCEALENFNNCNISFSNLSNAFHHTFKLKNFPFEQDYGNSFTGFKFKSDIRYAGGAFTRCGSEALLENSEDKNVKISDLLEFVKNLSLTYSNYIFSGMSPESLGNSNSPIILNWINCGSSFSRPAWYINEDLVHSDTSNTAAPDYEYFCMSTGSYHPSAAMTPESIYDENNTKEIYIKLPKANNVNCMFTETNIKICNSNVFENNNSLLYAISFLAYTQLEILIDLSNCKNLLDVKFFYNYTQLKNLADGFNPKLPTTLNHNNGIIVSNMFRETNLTGIDVKNVFKNVDVTNACGCFKDTNCNCSGSPFGENNNNIDISSIFAEDINKQWSINRYLQRGLITDLSWITSNMITSNLGFSSRFNSTQTEILGGTFEGRMIENFLNIPEYNTLNTRLTLPDVSSENIRLTSLNSMFKNSTILSIKSGEILEFTISGQISTSIFENTLFQFIGGDELLKIIISNKVLKLNSAFNRATVRAEIDLLENNNISNLDECFYRTKGFIQFKKHEINYIYFPKLTTARRAFSDSTAIIDNTFPKAEGNEDTEKINLFNQCALLSNIEKMFLYVELLNTNLDLSSCTLIVNMNYAFAGSKLPMLPKLPATFMNLQSAKGAFRKLSLTNLLNNSSINIKSSTLQDASELFAESSAKNSSNLSVQISVNIESPILNTINASSTSNCFNINIRSDNSPIYALLPEGGKISTVSYPMNASLSVSITNAEESRQLYVNSGEKYWLSISTNRSLIELNNRADVGNLDLRYRG